MSESWSCYALGGVINLGYIRFHGRIRSKARLCTPTIWSAEPVFYSRQGLEGEAEQVLNILDVECYVLEGHARLLSDACCVIPAGNCQLPNFLVNLDFNERHDYGAYMNDPKLLAANTTIGIRALRCSNSARVPHLHAVSNSVQSQHTKPQPPPTGDECSDF